MVVSSNGLGDGRIRDGFLENVVFRWFLKNERIKKKRLIIEVELK